MGCEAFSLRIVEDEIAKDYLDCLGEFSKQYGIPTVFTGQSSVELAPPLVCGSLSIRTGKSTIPSDFLSKIEFSGYVNK